MRSHHDALAVDHLIDDLAAKISRSVPPSPVPLTVIGIRTRGEILADRLVAKLHAAGHRSIERGVLDITLYRDDLSEIGPGPLVRPSRIDTDLTAKPLILVDDVLFTGRTVRAALNALADYGRPSAIRLAVLVDRGGRELPIQPDFVALVERDVPSTHRVRVQLAEHDGVDAIDIDPRS